MRPTLAVSVAVLVAGAAACLLLRGRFPDISAERRGAEPGGRAAEAVTSAPSATNRGQMAAGSAPADAGDSRG